MTRVCLTCGEPYSGRYDGVVEDTCESCGKRRKFGTRTEYEAT